MSKKLKDTNLPAHAIVEVFDDGSALRNDGVELGAANDNPWYVLATVFGEQEEGAHPFNYDKKLAAQNRRAWNGWFCDGLSDEERKRLAEKTGLGIADLASLTNDELKEITKRFQARMGVDKNLPAATENINFSKVYFSKPIYFEEFIFEKKAFFRSAMFSGGASFHSVMFSGGTSFSSAYFSRTANFRSASFNGLASFRSASFIGGANFRFVKFSGNTYFKYARFSRNSDFSSAMLKSPTDFYDAKFLTAVPKFHAAELYDDTTFTLPDNFRDNWPPLEGEVPIEGQEELVKVMRAEDQKRAYNRLRLFMNQSLQIEEEQFFHRMEMRCKMVMANRWHKPFYWVFQKGSDFGISVWRPLVGLALLIALGALALAFCFDMTGRVSQGSTFWETTGWSMANTLPFLGYDKLHHGMDYAKELLVQLKIIAGGQTLSGYILLFFLGLGLRNKFRLR